jgi:hypothetical protein
MTREEAWQWLTSQGTRVELPRAIADLVNEAEARGYARGIEAAREVSAAVFDEYRGRADATPQPIGETWLLRSQGARNCIGAMNQLLGGATVEEAKMEVRLVMGAARGLQDGAP